MSRVIFVTPDPDLSWGEWVITNGYKDYYLIDPRERDVKETLAKLPAFPVIFADRYPDKDAIYIPVEGKDRTFYYVINPSSAPPIPEKIEIKSDNLAIQFNLNWWLRPGAKWEESFLNSTYNRDDILAENTYDAKKFISLNQFMITLDSQSMKCETSEQATMPPIQDERPESKRPWYTIQRAYLTGLIPSKTAAALQRVFKEKSYPIGVMTADWVSPGTEVFLDAAGYLSVTVEVAPKYQGLPEEWSPFTSLPSDYKPSRVERFMSEDQKKRLPPHGKEGEVSRQAIIDVYRERSKPSRLQVKRMREALRDLVYISFYAKDPCLATDLFLDAILRVLIKASQ